LPTFLSKNSLLDTCVVKTFLFKIHLSALLTFGHFQSLKVPFQVLLSLPSFLGPSRFLMALVCCLTFLAFWVYFLRQVPMPSSKELQCFYVLDFQRYKLK